MTKKTKTFRFYAQMQKPNIILSENFQLWKWSKVRGNCLQIISPLPIRNDASHCLWTWNISLSDLHLGGGCAALSWPLIGSLTTVLASDWSTQTGGWSGSHLTRAVTVQLRQRCADLKQKQIWIETVSTKLMSQYTIWSQCLQNHVTRRDNRAI